MKRVISNGRKKVNQPHSIISHLCARRLLLLSVLRPSIEYGSEVWKCNKSQTSDLESILFWGEQKRFLDAHLGPVVRQLEGTWV